jgi:hypothetical protein
MMRFDAVQRHDLMRCSQWTVCKLRCVRMRVVSNRVLEMSLLRGLVRRVRREVRLEMVDV